MSVDLGGGVCPDGKFSDQLGPVADGRPDGMHFSDPGADWVASWLAPRLVDPWLRNPDITSTRAAPLLSPVRVGTGPEHDARVRFVALPVRILAVGAAAPSLRLTAKEAGSAWGRGGGRGPGRACARPTRTR